VNATTLLKTGNSSVWLEGEVLLLAGVAAGGEVVFLEAFGAGGIEGWEGIVLFVEDELFEAGGLGMV